MTDETKARLIADAGVMLANALRSSDGKYNRTAQRNLFDLCNAVIGLIDDGNAWEQREALMHDLQCNEEGEPIDYDGPLDFVPRNMVPAWAVSL